MRDFGGMISVLVGNAEDAAALVTRTRVWTLAESLGGVESLIEVPVAMTHASTADAPFAVPADLVRLSVGLESANDLVADLEQALAAVGDADGLVRGRPGREPAAECDAPRRRIEPDPSVGTNATVPSSSTAIHLPSGDQSGNFCRRSRSRVRFVGSPDPSAGTTKTSKSAVRSRSRAGGSKPSGVARVDSNAIRRRPATRSGTCRRRGSPSDGAARFRRR